MTREDKIELLKIMIEKEHKAIEILKRLSQSPYMVGRIQRAEISIESYELLLRKMLKGDIW